MIEWRTVLFGIVVIGSIAAAKYYSALYGPPSRPSQLTLVNRSTEPVSEARLLQGGRDMTTIAVEPGQIRSIDFISRTGSLTLVAKFKSGRSVSVDNVGFLAAGNPVVVTFEVTDDKVTLITIAKRREGSGRGR